MPTYEEMASDVRDAFGIGTKNYENPPKVGMPFQDRKVNVVAVVESEDDANLVRKSVKNQTYSNVTVSFVNESESLPFALNKNERYVSGYGFFDAVSLYRKILPEDCGEFITEFVIGNFWMPGHIESLVRVSEDGIPVASMSKLHSEAGWDGLEPVDNEFVSSECVLWGMEDLWAWESDNEFEAVDNLLKDNPPIARTNMPTVVTPA